MLVYSLILGVNLSVFIEIFNSIKTSYREIFTMKREFGISLSILVGKSPQKPKKVSFRG